MGSIWRTPARRDIALVCLAVLLVGVSYGAIAVADGFPVWLPAVQSVVVLAGSSELLFVGVVAAGGNPIAVALAGVLVNTRHVPYGLALEPGTTGSTWLSRLFGTHVMNDESVVFALAHPDNSRKVFWACGVGVLLCWPAGAILGAYAGEAIHNTSAFGLDAMFPAVILALILPKLKDRKTLRAAAVAVAIALATAPFLPAGLPVLLALAALPLARSKPARTGTARSETARTGTAPTGTAHTGTAHTGTACSEAARTETVR
jgi:4-azaleucine resistance transporter AzlC